MADASPPHTAIFVAYLIANVLITSFAVGEGVIVARYLRSKRTIGGFVEALYGSSIALALIGFGFLGLLTISLLYTANPNTPAGPLILIDFVFFQTSVVGVWWTIHRIRRTVMEPREG